MKRPLPYKINDHYHIYETGRMRVIKSLMRVGGSVAQKAGQTRHRRVTWHVCFCREPDHSAGQCALSYLQSPLVSVVHQGPGHRLDVGRSHWLVYVCHGTRGGAASRVRAGSDIFVLHATSLIWPEIVGRLPRGRSTRP